MSSNPNFFGFPYLSPPPPHYFPFPPKVTPPPSPPSWTVTPPKPPTPVVSTPPPKPPTPTKSTPPPKPPSPAKSRPPPKPPTPVVAAPPPPPRHAVPPSSPIVRPPPRPIAPPPPHIVPPSPGPHGTQSVVLSIEEDVHIQEAIKMNERVGKGLHTKSVDSNEGLLGTKSAESASRSLDIGASTSGSSNQLNNNKPFVTFFRTQ